MGKLVAGFTEGKIGDGGICCRVLKKSDGGAAALSNFEGKHV